MYSRAVGSLFLAAVAVVCVLFAGTSSRAPFGYDEADYMYAGTQGFAANYLDRGSQSLAAYVQKGLELARNPALRQSMSEYVRSSGDVAFYRHYHGPMYAYWISLWHALGARREAAYRATGLILHALGAVAIFWLFLRVFPELPVQGALVAGMTFALNRTALVTATIITQHGVFAVLSCLTLFAAAQFLRTRRMRWWYVTAALLAASFATVEISVVLIAAILTIVALEWNRGWKALLALLGRGAAIFVAALALLWPKGVFELGALKGYLYLAYMALSRKTFSPIGPAELWGFKLRTYPFEFVLPLFAIVLGSLWLRTLKSSRSAAPFLIYAALFFGTTLVITLPYTYYHASLMASLAVLTGVMFGEAWERGGGAVRAVTMMAVLASLVVQNASYYRETARAQAAAPAGTAEVLRYFEERPAAGTVFVPYVLVPPLHYYRPEIRTVGYDDDWSVERLARESSSAPAAEVLCTASMCQQLESFWIPGALLTKEPVGQAPPTAETLYAAMLQPPAQR